MKRIVFLICLLFMTPIQTSADIVEGCNNGEIEFTRNQGDIIVNKRGENPFLKAIDIPGSSIRISNIVCHQDRYIMYGFVHTPSADTYYDSVIIELDVDGNITNTLIKDYGELEEVKHLFYVDNIYIVITEQSIENDDMTFNGNFITIYDHQYNEIMFEYYEEEFKKLILKDNLLSINFEWDPFYDIGVLTDGTTIYNQDYLLIEEEYTNEVYVPFVNDAYINGVKHSNGFYTDYPGNYTLTYNDQTYTFKVNPSITGVEDKQTYKDEVKIQYSNGQVFVNDALYVSNESIREPGYYHVDVYGNNNYHKELSFTINADITGLINGQTYTEPISVTFTGQGYLNGNIVTSPLIVDTEGDYVFRVTGENGYSEEYFFDITYEDQFSVIEFVQKIDIYIIVVVVLGGVIVIKKSK